MTELMTIVAWPADLPYLRGCTGRPLPGVSIKVSIDRVALARSREDNQQVDIDLYLTGRPRYTVETPKFVAQLCELSGICLAMLLSHIHIFCTDSYNGNVVGAQNKCTRDIVFIVRVRGLPFRYPTLTYMLRG